MQKTYPAAYLCSSDLEIADLIGLAKASSDKLFVLALDYKKGIEDRLLPAYLNASVRFSEGSNRSKGMAIETLLFVSGKMNIENAINKSVAKDNKSFVLFSNNTKYLDAFIKRNNIKIVKKLHLKLDIEISASIAVTSILKYKQKE